jgi:hypothetical protein
MATVVPRELKIGTVVDKTLAVVERSAGPALIFVAALTALNAAGTYLSLEMAPMQQLVVGLVKFVVGVVCSYFLIEAMVRLTGVRSRTDEERLLSYLGLSILSILGVGLGLIVVVLPGLLIWARWSIAAPLLVARGDGVTQALGQSWHLTRGNEFPILVAALALLLLPVAIMIACAVLFERDNLIRIVVSELAGTGITVITLAIGVALYALIVVSRTAAAPPG